METLTTQKVVTGNKYEDLQVILNNPRTVKTMALSGMQIS
jgi:hypothetical protein